MTPQRPPLFPDLTHPSKVHYDWAEKMPEYWESLDIRYKDVKFQFKEYPEARKAFKRKYGV